MLYGLPVQSPNGNVLRMAPLRFNVCTCSRGVLWQFTLLYGKLGIDVASLVARAKRMKTAMLLIAGIDSSFMLASPKDEFPSQDALLVAHQVFFGVFV